MEGGGLWRGGGLWTVQWWQGRRQLADLADSCQHNSGQAPVQREKALGRGSSDTGDSLAGQLSSLGERLGKVWKA